MSLLGDDGRPPAAGIEPFRNPTRPPGPSLLPPEFLEAIAKQEERAELAHRDPETRPLAWIALDLGPEPATFLDARKTSDAEQRAIIERDLADAIADANGDPDEIDHARRDHRTSLAWHESFLAWEASAVGRASAVLDGADWFNNGASRVSAPCPACQPFDWVDGPASRYLQRRDPDANRLVVDVAKGSPSVTGLNAACLNRCAPEVIGAALASEVREHEQREASAVVTSEAAALAAEMDVLAAPTKPQEWLIPSLVPASSATSLVGLSGGGKSWLMIHMGICIALGIDFLGRPVKRGRVLLVFLESFSINARRIDCLARGLGSSLEALRGWLDVWQGPLTSDDSGSMAELGRRVRVLQYAAVLIDNATKLRSTRTQSAENDSSIMGAVFEPLALLAQEGIVNGQRITKQPPAVLVLHHAGKDGTPRGSSGIQGELDYVLELRRHSQKDPESPITIGIGAGSRLPCEAPIALRYRGLGPGPVVPELVGRSEESPRVGSSRPKHDRILELLDAAEDGLGSNALATAVGGSKRDVFKARDELGAEGAIEQIDGKWHRA